MWQRVRFVVQLSALVLFVYLLLGNRRGGETALPEDLFFRLDPLTGAAAMLSSRSWMAPLTAGFIVLGMTVFLGRFWCGWLCPLGSMVEWVPGRHRKVTRKPVSEKSARGYWPHWRHIKYVLLIAILVDAAYGRLSLMALDPITIVYRAIAGVVLPGANHVLESAEGRLAAVEWMARPMGWFGEWSSEARRGILPLHKPNLVMLGFLGAILALNLLRARFWCRNLCPLGAMLALASRVPLLRRRVNVQKCVSCAKCASACDMGAVAGATGFAANRAECVDCLDCMELCPTRGIHFLGREAPAVPKRFVPSRRRFLVAAGSGLAGGALAMLIPRIGGAQAPAVRRPPRASADALLSRCIRCGMCIKVCPQGIIQPVHEQVGLAWLWTPQRIQGRCQRGCSACAQVCPTGAIGRIGTVDFFGGGRGAGRFEGRSGGRGGARGGEGFGRGRRGRR